MIESSSSEEVGTPGCSWWKNGSDEGSESPITQKSTAPKVKPEGRSGEGERHSEEKPEEGEEATKPVNKEATDKKGD